MHILNSINLYMLYVTLFVLGAIVGSFVNVWIARLSRDKSVIWPLSSRCGSCFQPIRWYDNLPLISYLVLRGRCRTCGATFSARYLFVELIMAVGFPAIFYLEIVQNIHGIPAFEHAETYLRLNPFNRWSLPYFFYFLHHALLLSLLVACAGCDLQYRTIPLSLTMTGTVLGLILAVIFPWPWPNTPFQAAAHPPNGVTEWWLLGPDQMEKMGLYPWPVWGPLPAWLPAGSARLGLATGLVGALVGTFLLRAIKFLFEKGLRKEALGLGDADLMMMAGAFLGWQPIVIGFLVGGLVSLVLALPNLIMQGERELPFGPGLAIGIVLTWMSWSLIGPEAQMVLFHPMLLFFFGAGCGAVILVLSYVLSKFQSQAQNA